MTTKKLEELSLEEMRAVAEAYGLETAGKTKDKLKTALTSGTSIDPWAVEIPEMAQPKRPEDLPPNRKKIRVIFPKQDGVEGQEDVKITLNGYRWRVRRGEEVELPPEAIGVVDDAIITEMHRDEKTGDYIEVNRKRFHYQVLSA